MTGVRRLVAGCAVIALAVGATGSTTARLSGSTGNAANSYSVAPDFVAPTVSAASVAESPGNPTYVSEVLADSPLGYWRLGETSGTTAVDMSGNGRNGTYAGTYTRGTKGAITALDTATYFGIGSVDIVSSTLQPSTAVTVEAWVKPTATCGNCAIFDKSANGGTNSSFLMWEASGRVKCRFIKGGTQYNVQSDGLIPDDVWSHVACTWDGTTIRMYVDGTVQSQTTALTAPISTGTGWSRIGRLADGTYSMYGEIDEVAVYGTALSQTRITAHYKAAFGGYPDAVRQCHAYYAFGSAIDSGNPPSGVAAMTANLNSLSPGDTAIALSSGSYPLQSITYGFRSPARFTAAGAGSYTFGLTSTDAAANSRIENGFPAIVVAADADPVSAVFLTGLEQGVAAPTAPGVFSSVTGAGVSADAAITRNGAYSLRVAPANAAAYAAATLTGAGSTAVARFAVRLATLPAATVELAVVTPASGNSAIVVYNAASGRFGVRWGAGTIVDGTITAVAGTWYTIEILASFVNPHRLDWRIDGTDQTAATSSEASASVVTLSLGTAATNVTYTANFDDVIASRTSTDYPIGDGKVLALTPSGMGTHNTVTRFLEEDGTAIDASSWNKLDDVPATSTADYVKQISNGTSSYLEITLQDTAESCIQAVSALLAYHSAAGTTNSGKTSVFSGATESIVFNGDMTGLTNPLGYKRAMVTSSVGGVWSTAAVNALVFRVGYSGDVSPNPYWDALLIEYDVPTGP